MAIAALCGLLFFSACSHQQPNHASKLNSLSYAFHYRHLDSTQVLARQAFHAAIKQPREKAAALNNLAFVAIMRMDYTQADSLLKAVYTTTDNSIECLIADIQMMRLCQRQSHNKEFYDYREQADRRLEQCISREKSLSSTDKMKLLYAQTEYAIVTSTYYYYVGLLEQSAAAIQQMNSLGELHQDTAQYLNYLYNIGSGGVILAQTKEEVSSKETDYLLRCLFLSKESGHIFFTANALQSIADHMLNSTRDINSPNFQLQVLLLNKVCPGSLPRLTATAADSLPLRLCRKALEIFRSYGDTYQVAGAYRSLASCQMAMGNYKDALTSLDSALSSPLIQQAPDLVASIYEQRSVAFAAIDDKRASDINRNKYLDIQEQTRQDRYLEARADQLDKESFWLNIYLVIVTAAILLLLFLLWFFHHLNQKSRSEFSLTRLLQPLEEWRKKTAVQHASIKEHIEEVEEEQAIARQRKEEGEETLLEGRAKLALVTSIIPLIDRMLNEVKRLNTISEQSRNSGQEEQQADHWEQERRKYIAEIAQQIHATNDVLTQWIKVRQGQLTLHIESFPLQPLFDILEKSSMGFSAKGIRLHISPTDAVVKADRPLTLFMLNTLTDNARKFTRQGGQVDIQSVTTDEYVEISVCNGPVLQSEQQEKEKGFGFGLKNCRGIIEKYRKTSRLFRVCAFTEESPDVSSRRFSFRLPKGIVRLVLLLLMPCLPSVFIQGSLTTEQQWLRKAKMYADSAYFSNIEANYRQALLFADSARQCLNQHYLCLYPQGKALLKKDNGTETVPIEIEWLRQNVQTDYHIILDFRNESAVAALALHQWKIYEYNNKIYTQLFKELSADTTLPDYCRKMQESKTKKTAAIVILAVILLAILPAYYLIYFRHLRRYRFFLKQVNAINKVLEDEDNNSEEKLNQVRKLSTDSFPDELNTVVQSVCLALEEDIDIQQRHHVALEQKEEELHTTHQEVELLHVGNAVLDNCLSALKHETMYYPSRILAQTDAPAQDLLQTVTYYRDIYTILTEQAMKAVEGHHFTMEHLTDCLLLRDSHATDKTLIANRTLVDYLYRLLRQWTGKDIHVTVSEKDHNYLLFTLRSDAFIGLSPSVFTTPTIHQIPFFICRQIIREHSESTRLRSCGISIRSQGTVEVVLGTNNRNKSSQTE